MSKAGWVVIPEALARAHPMFGLRKGPLFSFSLLLVAGLLRNAVGAAKYWSPVDTLDPSIWDTLGNAAIVVTLLLSLGFLVGWFSKWRGCRAAWVTLMVLDAVLAVVPIVTAVLLVRGGTVSGSVALDAMWPVGLALVIGTAVRGVLLAFMLTSPAYRVTFESRVRADDPVLLAPISGAVAA